MIVMIMVNEYLLTPHSHVCIDHRKQSNEVYIDYKYGMETIPQLLSKLSMRDLLPEVFVNELACGMENWIDNLIMEEYKSTV